MVMKASTKPKVKTGNIVIALREGGKVGNKVGNLHLVLCLCICESSKEEIIYVQLN